MKSRGLVVALGIYYLTEPVARENEQADLFKDPKMLQRFKDIAVLPEKEKECLLTTVDHFIKASKINLI